MRIPLSLTLTTCVLLAACDVESAPEVRAADPDLFAPAPKAANPIVGTWELVRGEYHDQVRDAAPPFQLKLFTPTHFAYVMRDEDGSFSEAGAGPYTLDDESYTETHAYQSQREYVGFVATWAYRLIGDTLYMEGPMQVLDASGNPVTERIPRMKELRVRAR
jgi:hypothetical protein